MLEILECKDIEKYSHILNNIKTDGKLHVVEAFNKNNVIGYGIYAYNLEVVEIFDFDDGGDLYLGDGIIRSILFKACLKGIDDAVFKINNSDKISKLEKLNFVKGDNKVLNSINDFMNSCKNCKKID
ncbi:MAG: hypothetical protein GX286_03555 [Clostridiales bacterium]|jgi:hypothetical protein|nr:hypothetical protein [Clostridiales bacterium]